MKFKVLLLIILALLNTATPERIQLLPKIRPPAAAKLLGLGAKTNPDIPLLPYVIADRPIG